MNGRKNRPSTPQEDKSGQLNATFTWSFRLIGIFVQNNLFRYWIELSFIKSYICIKKFFKKIDDNQTKMF